MDKVTNHDVLKGVDEDRRNMAMKT